MRILKAQNREFDNTFINHKGVLCRMTVQAAEVPLNDICMGIEQTAREEIDIFINLEKDILANGMRNPIVLLPNLKDYYEWGFLGIRADLVQDYDPTKLFLCIFGSQRMHIAARAGYDAIDAYYTKDLNYGLLIGKTLEDKRYSCPRENST